jgi:hypothetical protein
MKPKILKTKGSLKMNSLFRTSILRAAPAAGVDRKAKRISGVKVMQLGKVNDSRPWEVDDRTLDQVINFGNGQANGVKARFTHPSMSDDGFGKYLGRWTNFRREGDAAYADLQLADSSFDTPNGDLGTYVMDLAQEDPEAFGVSASTMLARVMESEVPEGEVIPLRLDGLRAVDFVDEPAATRGGLFDMTTPSGLPALATWIVETHFSDREPREVVERMCSFLSKHYGRDVMSDVLAGQAGQEQNPAPAPVAPAGLSLDGAKPFIEAFGDRGATWYLQGRSMGDCFGDLTKELRAENSDLAAKVADLETRLEAALKAAGGEDSALSAEPRVELTDEKKKANQKQTELKSKGASDVAAKWGAALSSN